MDDLNRCFVGIKLPSEVQQRLQMAQQAIRQRAGGDVVRWSNPAELLLVILPLGELTVGTLNQVKASLPSAAAGIGSFRIEVSGFGGSPSALQPRFAWAGIEGDTHALKQLHFYVEKAMAPLLPSYQAKEYQPRIDLGRIKIESEQNRTALGRAIRMCQFGSMGNFDVGQFELFRSEAASTGPHLEAIASYSLSS